MTRLEVDARARKVLADLVDARVDLALSALAVALGSTAVQVWHPPKALALVGVVPSAALVLAQGGARIGRARARERAAWQALGAGGEFEARVTQLESGLFGALAGLAGGLAGSGVALVVGAPAVSNALAWAGVWLVGATGAAMVGASAANGRTSEQHWPA